jgi:hypothetical protein
LRSQFLIFAFTVRSDIAVHSYPLVFAVVALPLSVVRWSTGFGSAEPTATFAVEFIYSLSGALNVLLFLFTRSPLLLPRNKAKTGNGLGVAQNVIFTPSKSRFSETGRPDSAILGARDKPVPLGPIGLLCNHDVAWHLPSQHCSNESV